MNWPIVWFLLTAALLFYWRALSLTHARIRRARERDR